MDAAQHLCAKGGLTPWRLDVVNNMTHASPLPLSLDLSAGQVEELVKTFNSLKEDIQKATKYFCEKPKTPPEQLFGIFADFGDQWKRTVNDIAKAKEAKERAEKRALAAAQRKAKPKSPRPPPKGGAGGGGVVDKVVGQLKSTNASSIAAAIRKRREQRATLRK